MRTVLFYCKLNFCLLAGQSRFTVPLNVGWATDQTIKQSLFRFKKYKFQLKVKLTRIFTSLSWKSSNDPAAFWDHCEGTTDSNPTGPLPQQSVILPLSHHIVQVHLLEGPPPHLNVGGGGAEQFSTAHFDVYGGVPQYGHAAHPGL